MDIINNYLSINQMTRPGVKLKAVKKIVVHYVGNPTSTAIANRNYFESLSKQTEKYASSQYIIGLEGEIICCIPEDEVAWHSGELEMNYNSIGIENCHLDDSGIFGEKTLNSLYELLTELCKKYNLNPKEDIIRHYDVIGKACPRYYVDNPDEWEKLKNVVYDRINNTDNQPDNNVLLGKYKVTPKVGLNCRQLPDINSKKITAYAYGTIIDIFELSNNWGRTKDGWVSMQYTENIEKLSKKYVVTPQIGLNCRQQPNISSKRITAYVYGTVIEIYEQTNGWGRTKDGWVSMQYVKQV